MSTRALGGAVAFAAAVALMTGGAAQAAPTWLSPSPLSATGSSAEAPQVGVDARGDSLAAWVRNGVVEVSGRPAGAAGWEPAQRISPAGVEAQAPVVGIDSAGDAVAAWRSIS